MCLVQFYMFEYMEPFVFLEVARKEAIAPSSCLKPNTEMNKLPAVHLKPALDQIQLLYVQLYTSMVMALIPKLLTLGHLQMHSGCLHIAMP